MIYARKTSQVMKILEKQAVQSEENILETTFYTLMYYSILQNFPFKFPHLLTIQNIISNVF